MPKFPATLWRWDLLRPTTNTGPFHKLQSFITDFTNDNNLPDQLLPMAPVSLERDISYGPAAVVASHAVAAVYLMVEAGRSLHRAYQNLGPSQDTRGQIARRNVLLPLFAGLALISLARAVYGAVDYGVLSYKVWASTYGLELPVRLYGDKGIFGENATPVYLNHWLNDTPIYLDALQILTEKPRRFWWGQQLDLGLISWSMFLAIEGRRRNIRLLWGYQLLGQIVSLAFAQNLFFVAMLLTPVPLPVQAGGSSPLARFARLVFPQKPANWTPNVSVFAILLTLNYANIFWAPTQFGDASFKYWVLASRALTTAPLLVQYVIPASWGSRYRDIGDVYGTYKTLFKAISVVTFLLHLRTSLPALFFNEPDPHRHRHSVYLTSDVERRFAWERTTSAFGRLLESTSDHPVVGLVGADVILASVSIGFWVATRAMNTFDILACTMPGFSGQQEPEDKPAKPVTMAWWEAKALMSGANGTGVEAEEESPSRRRGRRRKSKSKTKKNEPDDGAYKPAPSEVSATEGDVLPSDDWDWESAAVVWGLTALGGLGLGSAGAYGSEIIAV
ncbi:hypothetical protein B0T10DRAFT_59835 [Thelonectria olida]|uniref:Uncharacterized protein n=1 Tax=Thelonectria olida TaxID=1576542 RepID=A0A9P8W6P5_9HYPO|nr:hypothetical protein B0T10DRAFT_59835 [Thelonectria olida]